MINKTCSLAFFCAAYFAASGAYAADERPVAEATEVEAPAEQPAPELQRPEDDPVDPAVADAGEASDAGPAERDSAPAKPRATGSRVGAAPVGDPRAEKSDANYDGPPLLFENKMHVGGYGGIHLGYANMLNRDGTLIGLEGALLLDHRLSLGLAGYGFTASPRGPVADDGGERRYHLGFGGVVVRYAIFTNLPVYASIGGLVGAGAIVLAPHNDRNFGNDGNDFSRDDVDVFTIFQPELGLHANVRRWMRFGLNAGYRVAMNVGKLGFEESEVNGVVLGGNVEFGWL